MTPTSTPFPPGTLPYEAVVRTPIGDLRVWIDFDDPAPPAGLVRTSVRLDYAGGDEDQARHAGQIGRVIAQLGQVARGLTGQVMPGAGGAALAATVGPWLAERTEPEPAARALTRDLWRDYLAWCDGQGLPPVGQADFGAQLTDRGFAPAGTFRQGGAQGRARGGLRLRPRLVGGAAMTAAAQ